MNQSPMSIRPQSVERRAAPRSQPVGRLLLRMLDEMQYGMVLLDGQARLGYSNALGRDEVLGGGPFLLRGGVLTCRDVARRSGFREALNGALRGRRQLLTFSTGGVVTSIALTPLRDGDDDDLQRHATHALLIFGRRPELTNLAIDFFARTNKLTAAESQILVHLSHGRDPAAIADRQCVAISTVRSQIASVRAKTSTASIRQLLERIAMLPPILTVVRAPLRQLAEVSG